MDISSRFPRNRALRVLLLSLSCPARYNIIVALTIVAMISGHQMPLSPWALFVLSLVALPNFYAASTQPPFARQILYLSPKRAITAANCFGDSAQ